MSSLITARSLSCKEKHMKVLKLFSSQMLFAALGGIVLAAKENFYFKEPYSV